MPLQDWLTQMTRMLWPLGFGRRPAPPTEQVQRSDQSQALPPSDAPKPERRTEIPPDQQPGGGSPHR